MKISNPNHSLDFAKGWTLNKLLKGGGIDVEPSEISGWEVISDLTLDEDIQYVDYTDLDINTDKTYQLIISLRNAYGSPTWVYLNINGLTTHGFYHSQFISGDNTSVAAGRGNYPRLTYLEVGNSVLSIVTIIKDVNGYLRAFVSNNRKAYDAMMVELRAISSTFVMENITSIKVRSGYPDGMGSGSRLLLTKPRCG